MTEPQNSWTKSDSQHYQRLAPAAVPAGVEQIASLLTLLPFKQNEPFRVVELGCGEGTLSFALLDCFPQAWLIALDGSAAMRAQAAERLQPFGIRARLEPFDLASSAWFPYVNETDCVLSSLCVHHLSGLRKQALFAALYRRLSARGVLLFADLVEPQHPQARQLFAATWDRLAQTQSLAETGSTELFEQFVESEWNYYYFDDPVDTPSPLFDQLIWLKEAGFKVVDCFWLRAGHAIYGGYKRGTGQEGGVPFAVALRSAEKALTELLLS